MSTSGALQGSTATSATLNLCELIIMLNFRITHCMAAKDAELYLVLHMLTAAAVLYTANSSDKVR